MDHQHRAETVGEGDQDSSQPQPAGFSGLRAAQQIISQQADERGADGEDEFARFADAIPGHQQRIDDEEQGERAEGQGPAPRHEEGGAQQDIALDDEGGDAGDVMQTVRFGARSCQDNHIAADGRVGVKEGKYGGYADEAKYGGGERAPTAIALPPPERAYGTGHNEQARHG